MTTRKHDVIDAPVAQVGGRTPVSNERLVEVGAVNIKIDGMKRTIPSPWADCAACGRRHYPSTIGGRWHIATTCVSCGADLPGRS